MLCKTSPPFSSELTSKWTAKSSLPEVPSWALLTGLSFLVLQCASVFLSWGVSLTFQLNHLVLQSSSGISVSSKSSAFYLLLFLSAKFHTDVGSRAGFSSLYYIPSNSPTVTTLLLYSALRRTAGLHLPSLHAYIQLFTNEFPGCVLLMWFFSSYFLFCFSVTSSSTYLHIALPLSDILVGFFIRFRLLLLLNSLPFIWCSLFIRFPCRFLVFSYFCFIPACPSLVIEDCIHPQFLILCPFLPWWWCGSVSLDLRKVDFLNLQTFF